MSKKSVIDDFVALFCNPIHYHLIICSSSYLSFFVFHLFALKITQRRMINYIDPLTMHRFRCIQKYSSSIFRTKSAATKKLLNLLIITQLLT